jgi:hypothetical protein
VPSTIAYSNVTKTLQFKLLHFLVLSLPKKHGSTTNIILVGFQALIERIKDEKSHSPCGPDMRCLCRQSANPNAATRRD